MTNYINAIDSDCNLSSIMTNKYIEELRKHYDTSIIKFLKINNIDVPEIITNNWLIDLKKNLANQDKFINTIEYIDYNFKQSKAIHYIIPFFDSISNPLSEESKQLILETYKKLHNKQKEVNNDKNIE